MSSIISMEPINTMNPHSSIDVCEVPDNAVIELVVTDLNLKFADTVTAYHRSILGTFRHLTALSRCELKSFEKFLKRKLKKADQRLLKKYDPKDRQSREEARREEKHYCHAAVILTITRAILSNRETGGMPFIIAN